MLFSTPAFFVFFILYLILHRTLPKYRRVYLIIFGSLIFYGYWNPIYLIGPPILILMTFYGVKWMAATKDPKQKKLFLISIIIALVIPLLFFKYTNFIYNDVLRIVGKGRQNLIDIPLPLGISFLTFTFLSYVVDVYKKRFPVERSLSYFWACILYFPHLIAGPIIRPTLLIRQFKKPKLFNKPLAWVGVAIFTLGLFKKLVFADQIASVVNGVYQSEQVLGFVDYWLAFYGFAMQIYCDFSGYTDMALGTSIILGVRLPQNFLRPYAAVSIVDFWRRWHITLSHWLRDYIYIPLGGNRQGFGKAMRNVMITMGIGGLWHGANWTFVIWGLLHGIGITIVHSARKFFPAITRIPKALAIFLTFHFVSVAWVFFRAPNFEKALAIFKGLLPTGDVLGTFQTGVSTHLFPVVLLGIFALLHPFDKHALVRLWVKKLPRSYTLAILLFVWILTMSISAGNSAEFIYFDF